MKYILTFLLICSILLSLTACTVASSAPSVPSAPSAPTEPSAPSAPTEPSAPSAPTEPSAPSAPTEPSVPLPTEPSAPLLPAGPISCVRTAHVSGTIYLEHDDYRAGERMPEFSGIIRSVEDLEAYIIEKFEKMPSESKVPDSPNTSYLDYSAFDDAFFQSNSLVIGIIYERGSATMLEFKDCQRTADGSYNIQLEIPVIWVNEHSGPCLASIVFYELRGVTDTAPVTVEVEYPNRT